MTRDTLTHCCLALITVLLIAGVVERASKELSRRFTSFTQRSRRNNKHEKLEARKKKSWTGFYPILFVKLNFYKFFQLRLRLVFLDLLGVNISSNSDHWQDISEAAVEQSDHLNGNAQPLSSWGAPGLKSREKPSMGITKGTVMDKVTNIFSSSNSDTTIMGNQVNKEKDKEKDINGINIPKGAVANGRAKFESQRISPEKPLRFFASRSRPGTPILAVKTPRVPVTSDVLGKNVVYIFIRNGISVFT